MPWPLVDEVGNAFGRWTVIGPPQKLGSHVAYLCRCECGTEAVVRRYQLKHELSKSCGCLAAELSSERKTTHGLSNSPEFYSWKSMRERCYRPGRRDAHIYYDKGITVCDRWLGKDGFANFYADMGPRPTQTTLGRIDGNKGYSPDNCRWETLIEQANNVSTNRIIVYRNQKMTLAQAARAAGIRADTAAWRLKHWGSIDKPQRENAA